MGVREKDEGWITLSEDHIRWVKRRLRAQRKHLRWMAASRLLTGNECKWLDRPTDTRLADLTDDELGRLANRHLDCMQGIQLFWRECEQYSNSASCQVMFAEERLNTLCQMLGEEQFEAAIGDAQAEWERKFAEAEEQERNLPPCLTCGARRKLATLSSLDDRICGGCELDMREAELGPCPHCGGKRELVGSAYTGGLCQQCAEEQSAPCTQCGRKRLLGRDDGGLCWRCLEQRLGQCAKCGRKLNPAVAHFGSDLCCDCFAEERAAIPCPNCGGKRGRGGWAHTGELCRTCAEERLAPCTRCGGKRKLGRDEGALCGRCRVNRHFNLNDETEGVARPQ